MAAGAAGTEEHGLMQTALRGRSRQGRRMENFRSFGQIRNAPYFQNMGKPVEIPGHIRISTEEMAVFLYKKKRNFTMAANTAYSLIALSRLDPVKVETYCRGEQVDPVYAHLRDFTRLKNQVVNLWTPTVEKLQTCDIVKDFVSRHNLDMDAFLGPSPVSAVLEEYVFPGHSTYIFCRQV